MHAGWGEVYSYSFRLFFDAWSKSSWDSLFVLKVPGNESSWNIRSWGAKVPRERMFQGVLGTFLERSFPMNESSTAANVPRNESSICGLLAPGNENVQRNEKSVIKFWYIKMSIAESWQQFVLKKKNLLSYAAVETYCVGLYESFDEGQQINNCPYNDCRPTRCYLIVRWTGLSILGLCLVRVSVIILKTSYYRHL